MNPVWNQTFDFVVEDGLHDMLIVEVWDHDTFGKVRKHALLINNMLMKQMQVIIMYKYRIPNELGYCSIKICGVACRITWADVY